MPLLQPVIEHRAKNPLPWNLIELGGVVVVIGVILAWRESNPESNVSAGALIAVIGLVLVVIGVFEILRRRQVRRYD